MGRANKISVLLGESRQHYHNVYQPGPVHFISVTCGDLLTSFLSWLRRSILLGGICINNGGTQREAGVNEVCACVGFSICQSRH